MSELIRIDHSTAGDEYITIFGCTICSVTTDGQHEYSCPNNKNRGGTK